MKYAYRLIRDTTDRNNKTAYTLIDEIFPVPDAMRTGLHKEKGDHYLEITFVFNRKEDAERSIEYERYAESIKDLPAEERRNLHIFDYNRINRYITFSRLEEVTGVRFQEKRYGGERFMPSQRYVARYHAVADIIEKHMDAIKKECSAGIVPEDRFFKTK